MQKLTRSLVMAGALAFAGVLAGCGDDVTVGDNLAVTVTPPSASIGVGQSVTFTASVTGGGSNKNVTWSTSDATKATVDATGKVTGVAVGNSTITATSAADASVKASALVTITTLSKGVQKVEISPNNAILAPGQTLQAVPNVTRDPGIAGTVTWTTSSAATATVDATGKVTAVAPGTATITAASTVDPTVTGGLAITVRAPVPASVSIQKVTVTGNTTNTVNFNNVAGGIDVTLNVDPGDQILQRVEVLLDGVVVCTQNFSASESQGLSLAAVFPDVQAVDVVCQINTAEFNATTGAAKYANGARALSARAIVQGGTSTATPSVTLTFNNQSGVVALISTANGTDPASAINPTTGLQWMGGDVNVSLVGVSYAPGVSVASVNFTLFGKTRNVVLTNNVATAAYSEATVWTATNTGVGNYQSPGAGETLAGASAVLSNGSPLVTTLPSIVLNFGSPAQGNANVPLLQTIRLDNTAPATTSANGIVQPALVVGSMPIWLNGAFAFDSTSTAVSTINDTGVDNLALEFYFIAGALPTASTCDLTGMTRVTVGSGLPETIVSSAYRGRLVVKDALGNRTCTDLAPGGVAGGLFGADFTAPSTPVFTAPGNDTTFITTAAADAATFAFTTLQDNASGFGTYPVLATLRRFNAAGTTTCLIGTTATTCAVKGDTTASVSATRNTATEGYYLYSGQVRDSALNVNTTVFNRRLLVDATPAAVVGILSMPSLIVGQGTSVFNGQVSDNIDLAQYYGLLTYTGAPVIRSATAALGTYGEDALTKTANVALTLNGTMRCLGLAPGGVPGAPAKLASIDLRVQDFAQANVDASTGITGGAQAIIPAAVETCAAIANVTSWTDSLPAAAVNISKAGTTAATATTVNLMARALVPLNVTNNPFQRVEFYRVNAGGELVLIGTGTPALTQTPTERIWTYSFTWDPPATLANGAVTIRAIGVTATGDGSLTAGQSLITIVP